MKYNLYWNPSDGAFVLQTEVWIKGEWVLDREVSVDPAPLFAGFAETGLHHMKVSQRAAKELAKRLAAETAKEPEPYEDYL